MSLTNVQEIALRETSEYFDGDPLAPDVFMKYALRNEAGELLETNPDQMHRRLAKAFAHVESKYPNPMSEEEIYGYFKNFADIVPQGSPMSGIGNPYQIQSLSNCFVIDSPKDSYGGILFSDQEQVQIMKRRGGVGFDVSNIRPKGLATSNAARTTDGIGVFMERFSNSCREVAQGGRRGALMLSIDCRHPEIETFINIKRDLKKVTGANISIRFTDEFMHAVKSGTDFTLRWPVEKSVESAEYTKTVSAKAIWDQFVDAAWSSAEPGALFWDNVTKNGTADIYESMGYKSISTNPCGEIALSPYDSCRLMVLNLTSFVNEPFSSSPRFDFDRFHKVAMRAQRLMDDLVDLEVECVDKIIKKLERDTEPNQVKQIERDLWQKIRAAGLNGRRTGLGITGLGDCLAALGVKYGSEESITWTEKIYRSLAIAAHTSSCILAHERGPFPMFEYKKEKDHEYLSKIMDACGESVKEMWRKTGRRNIALTTTAPVGCLTKDSKIMTDIGTMSLEEIFHENGIDTKDLIDHHGIWFDSNVDISVYDIHGNKQKITRLFWNGFGETKKITTKSTTIECSNEHKVLVLSDDGQRGLWKHARDLKTGDKIVKIK